MRKKTLLLLIGLIIITVLLFIIAVASSQNVKKSQEQTAQAEPTPVVAHTTLTLSPNPVQITAGKTGSVDVLIDTHGDQVTGVELEVGYDPEVITNVKFQPASFIPSPLILRNRVDAKNGDAFFILGVPPTGKPVSGTGTVATITFTQQSPLPTGVQQASLKVLPRTAVSAVGIRTSVLKQAKGTTIKLISNK